MKREKACFLAVLCAVSMSLSGCGAQVGGAVDRGLDMEGYTREESTRPPPRVPAVRSTCWSR